MEPLDALAITEKKLPTDLRDQILALGPAAVPGLIAILVDDDASDGDGWPPIHAVELLAALGAPEAIEPMLDVLVRTGFDDIVHDRLIQRLPSFGGAVLEPALRRVDAAEDEDTFDALISVLACLGVKDERVYDLIGERFEEDVTFGAMLFADYGDRRALPALRDAILDVQPDFSGRLWRFRMTELMDAYERLGGTVDSVVSSHVAAIDDAWKLQLGQTGRVGGFKIGRNDPCPCRSGKKFKRCCLGKVA
jgi:hypothetical protein